VGIKFGQFSSIWKIFGEAVARETAALKDRAKPLPKAEILEIMRAALEPEERARIKGLKRVLGSASLKTVVLIELVDGSEAVMLVQRAYASEQIESNLRLAQALLEELKKQGVPLAAGAHSALLAAVREQLAEEIRMTREAQKLAQAGGFYEELNRSMASVLSGWRFEVPALVPGFKVRDNMLFMEKAEGRSFKDLPEGLKAQVGPALAGSGLRLLFRRGWFDADRHAGNQLIDPEAKVIYPLDFGQAVSFTREAFWKPDERYLLAGFLRALETKDSRALARHGLAMGRKVASPDPKALEEALAAALREERPAMEKLVRVLNAFAEQGAELDGRFSFGAFKGLLTLYGEKYVPEEAFREGLSQEVSRLLRTKALPLLWDSLR